MLAAGGTLLTAAALVFLTPGSSDAAPHVGHIGGFHGAFGAGAFHGGGFRGGIRPGNFGYGGFNRGFYGGGFYGRGYYGGGFYRSGFTPYRSFGYWTSYYGYVPYSYGYYPSYYNYGPTYGYPSYPYSGADYWLGSAADPTYSNSAYQPSSAPDSAVDNRVTADAAAHVTVNLPADARIRFNGTAMAGAGSVRDFDTPPLASGRRFSYEVRASWNENGREVTQTQRVEVAAGARVNVTFPIPPTPTEEASALR